MTEFIKVSDYNLRERTCREALNHILIKREEYLARKPLVGMVRNQEEFAMFWSWVKTELVPSLDHRTKVHFLWKYLRASEPESFVYSRQNFCSDWKTKTTMEDWRTLYFPDEEIEMRKNYVLYRYDLLIIACLIRTTLNELCE